MDDIGFWPISRSIQLDRNSRWELETSEIGYVCTSFLKNSMFKKLVLSMVLAVSGAVGYADSELPENWTLQCNLNKSQ